MRGRGRLQANGTRGGSVGQDEWPGTQGSGTASCSRRLCKIHLQISAGIRGLLQIRIKPFRHQEGLGSWAALFGVFSINYQGLPKWLGMPGCGGLVAQGGSEGSRVRRRTSCGQRAKFLPRPVGSREPSPLVAMPGWQGTHRGCRCLWGSAAPGSCCGAVQRAGGEVSRGTPAPPATGACWFHLVPRSDPCWAACPLLAG